MCACERAREEETERARGRERKKEKERRRETKKENQREKGKVRERERDYTMMNEVCLNYWSLLQKSPIKIYNNLQKRPINLSILSKMGMGWLWSIGSIVLQVSFVEYCLFYRALLQKRPVILLILLTEATPYVY